MLTRIALCVCALLLLAAPAAGQGVIGLDAPGACTHWASPNGTGNGLSPSTPFKISNYIALGASVLPGKVLCLLDGTYTGADGMIKPPVGLSGNGTGADIPNGICPNCITIRALNDGGAVLDGQWVNPTIRFGTRGAESGGNQYWILEGFNFKQSSSELMGIFGGSDNNIFRRLVMWDIPVGLGSYKVLHWNSKNNLFEDVAAFGTGTGITHFGDAALTGIILRRTWFRLEGAISSNGESVYHLSYNATKDLLCDNCLSNENRISQPLAFTVQGGPSPAQVITDGIPPNTRLLYRIRGRSANYVLLPCAPFLNLKMFGSLGYVTATDRYVGKQGGLRAPGFGGATCASQTLDGVQLTHSLMFLDPANPWIANRTNPFTGIPRTGTCADDQSCLRGNGFTLAPAGPGGATNRLADHITSISANDGDTGIPDFWTRTNYARGTALSQVPSPWTVSLTSPGANLCHKYVNGVRTNEPLWPWPMEQRIRDATRTAGNYITNGGPCPTCTNTSTVLTRTEYSITDTIESILGPIPAQCRTGAPPSAGLVARYHINEASSGQGPTAIVDSGVTPLVNVPITYAGTPSQPTYTLPSTGAGLNWVTANGPGGPQLANIDGTKLKVRFHGQQRVTAVAAINWSALATSSRVFELGPLSIRIPTATTLEATFNSTTKATWTVASLTGSRKILHLVFDTTQPTAANRARASIDGTDQGNPVTTLMPVQNETLDLGTGASFTIGNNAAFTSASVGIVSYLALYDLAFTASERSADATALATDDDGGGSPPPPPPPPPPTGIFYDGEGTWSVSSTNTTLTPGQAANLPSGNQLFAILTSRTNGSAPSWTVQTGGVNWTQVGTTCHQTGTRNIALAVFRRQAGVSEPAPAVTISDVGQGHGAVVVTYRNVDPGTPLDATPVVSSSASATTWTPTGLTTATTDAKAVSVVATPNLNELRMNQAQGFTGRLTGPAWDTATGPQALGLADLSKAPAGAVTMPTWEQASVVPAATHILTDGSDVDQSSYTTASHSITANRLVLVAVSNVVGSGTANAPTITGHSGTWEQVATRLDGGNTRRLTVLRTMVGANSTGTLTISFAGQTRASWSIVEFANVDTSGTHGSGAIVQSPTNAASSVTSLTVTLAGFASSNNRPYAAFRASADLPLPDPGWLLLGSSGTTASLLTEWRDAADDTTPSASWTVSSLAVGIAAEVKSGLGTDEWCGITFALRLVGQAPDPPAGQGGGLLRLRRPVVTERPSIVNQPKVQPVERPLVTERPVVDPNPGAPGDTEPDPGTADP